jgi:hypothetical protein
MRRLLRARREPVTLAELIKLGVALDPVLVLTAVTAAIEPWWTAGHHLTVGFELAEAGTHHVVVDDGAAVKVTQEPPRPRARAGDRAPHATLHASPDALVAILARTTPPAGDPARVTGDRGVLETLLAWTDRVQGIPPKS